MALLTLKLTAKKNELVLWTLSMIWIWCVRNRILIDRSAFFLVVARLINSSKDGLLARWVYVQLSKVKKVLEMFSILHMTRFSGEFRIYA